jgi:Family of unknown function (DUF5318)
MATERSARGIRPKGRRAVLATVDYTLAKRALLGEVRDGLRSWADICDAHPELMRAAKHVGEETRRDCPVCAKAKLRLVTYVYGDGLREANGRVWPLDVGLSMAADRPGSWCYVVEVCTWCQWNHLSEAFVARAV